MKKSIGLVFLLSLFTLTQNILYAKSKTASANLKKPSTNQPNNQTLIDQNLIAMLYQKIDQRELDPVFFAAALSNHSEKIKILTLQGLGRIGGDTILPLAKPFLTAHSEAVRRAAVFAFAISGSKQASKNLWPLLEQEKNEWVKREIYIALGTLGGEGLILNMLKQVALEKNQLTQASIFQGLSKAVTYHRKISESMDMRKRQSAIDFKQLLALMKNDDELSYSVGYFLSRVNKIEKQLNASQLRKFIRLFKSNNNKKVLAKLIGKIAVTPHPVNRRLLSWLIEQSEEPDIALASEAIRAMGSLVSIPQARIQLGKLHISSNPQIAQTALETLANSSLKGLYINRLLKKQLKSEKPSMVVAAMSGLIRRQKRGDMIWALKIMSHKNTFIKIRFAKLIAEKNKEQFKNVLIKLSEDSNLSVARYARSLITANNQKTIQKAVTPAYLKAKTVTGKRVILHTSAGDIEIKLNDKAIYTGHRFIQLVEQGFYQGTYFSRVIGDFIAQGGDRVGDTDGGSGQTIREELSYLSHLKGTVGIATSGKDTGDSQFFINLSDNIHLDRQYSVFGKVTKGMANAYRLSNGDQIISAEIVLDKPVI